LSHLETTDRQHLPHSRSDLPDSLDSPGGASRFWSGFWQLADPKIWVASTVPMLVGAALAWRLTGTFELYWFLAALIGIYLIEIGKNAANEFVDYWTGVDRDVAPDKRTPFSGGKKAIVDNRLTLLEVLIITLVTMPLAAALGLYIVVFREPSILLIGFCGIMLSMFYSLPPLSFAYRGLGELAVGTTFGPLIVSGMYVLMARSFDVRIIAASLPVGFLITNVLWINQYPDYEADLSHNKMNWLVRLGKKRGLIVYQALYASAYASLVLSAIVFRSPLWLLGFASAPLAARSVRITKAHYDDIPNLVGANALTVQTYLSTGVAMVVGIILSRFL